MLGCIYKLISRNFARHILVKILFSYLVWGVLFPSIYYCQTNSCDIIWSDPVKLSIDSIPLTSPQLSISGDTIHVIWFGIDIFGTSSHNGIQYCHSFDGGISFSEQITIAPLGVASEPGFISSSGEFVYITFSGSDGTTSQILFLGSSDAGDTWEDTEIILTNSQPKIIAAHDSIVYIHFAGQQGAGNGILRSEDYGVIWETTNPQMPLLSDLKISQDTIHAVGIYDGERTEVGYYQITEGGAFSIGPEVISSEDLVASLYPKIAINDNRTFYIVWNDTGNVIFRRGGYDENGDLIWDNQFVISNDRYAVFPDIAVSGTYISTAWDNQDGEKRTILTRHSTDGSTSFCPTETPTMSMRAGEPSIELLRNRLHIVWSEEINEKGDVYYRQGVLPETRKVENNPITYALKQNYPNPFTAGTRLKFDLWTREHVVIRVYNLLGQLVATLLDDFQEAGDSNSRLPITFDGSNLPSGVYFYSITTPYFTSTKKMILIR